MPRPNVRKVVCGSEDCTWTGVQTDLRPLGGVDIRYIEAGDEMPAGICPGCGSFAYLLKPAYVGGV